MLRSVSLIALLLAVVVGCQKKDSCCTTAAKAEMSAPKASLVDTKWELTELNGVAPVATEGPAVNITLSSKDSRVAGMSSVNRLMGSCKFDGNQLTFSQMASTRMAGPEPLMKQEQAFLQALQATKSYRITGGTLELLDGEKVLAKFAAK